MAKGKEKHQERVTALQLFGKDLVRRAKSSCELCEQSGVKLEIYEVSPVPSIPVFEHCVLLCPSCLEQVEHAKRFRIGEHWRCPASTIWSEVPAVQVLAWRLLKRQEASQVWARETLENAMLDSDTVSWAEQDT